MLRKIIISLIVLMGMNNSLHTMQENNLIEFNGEKKSLLDWIKVSKSNHKHLFSVTLVARKTENGFDMNDNDILKMNKKDMQDVYKNNYVYCAFYALKLTRLSKGSFQPVGVIILGTTDKQASEDLQFSLVQRSKAKKNKGV